jgi:hypothetical protein
MSFDEAYSILAKKMIEKGFSAVLCGKDFTICLDFSNFKSGYFNEKMNDPRKFSHEERYTDFYKEDFIILSCPNFKVSKTQISKFSNKNSFNRRFAIYMATKLSKYGERSFFDKIIVLSKLLVKKGFDKESIDLFYLQKYTYQN